MHTHICATLLDQKTCGVLMTPSLKIEGRLNMFGGVLMAAVCSPAISRRKLLLLLLKERGDAPIAIFWLITIFKKPGWFWPVAICFCAKYIKRAAKFKSRWETLDRFLYLANWLSAEQKSKLMLSLNALKLKTAFSVCGHKKVSFESLRLNFYGEEKKPKAFYECIT